MLVRRRCLAQSVPWLLAPFEGHPAQLTHLLGRKRCALHSRLSLRLAPRRLQFSCYFQPECVQHQPEGSAAHLQHGVSPRHTAVSFIQLSSLATWLLWWLLFRFTVFVANTPVGLMESQTLSQHCISSNPFSPRGKKSEMDITTSMFK